MPWKCALAAAVWLMAASPAAAQVERVIVETEGMSEACRGPLEVALKLTDSVYKYALSIPKQMFSVVYYQNERFDPKRLKWAADQGEAYVLKFHVSVTGRIEEADGRRVLVAGEDRFFISGADGVPPGTKVGVIGVFEDVEGEWQLKPDDVQVIDESAAPAAPAAPPAPAK